MCDYYTMSDSEITAICRASSIGKYYLPYSGSLSFTKVHAVLTQFIFLRNSFFLCSTHVIENQSASTLGLHIESHTYSESSYKIPYSDLSSLCFV